MVLWDSWTNKAGLVVECDAQAWLRWGLEVAWVCGEREDGELSHELSDREHVGDGAVGRVNWLCQG